MTASEPVERSGARGALAPESVRRVYDRIGRLQDTQSFYEDPAIDELIAHSDLGSARRVVEIGCGTGRLARRLLDQHLPPEATYLGVELSPRMATVATERLGPYATRCTIEVADAARALPTADHTADRVLATYVFDLLDGPTTAAVLVQVERSLAPDGLLCAIGLTDGPGGIAHAVSRVWTGLWRWRPALVGGCRPIQLAEALADAGWQIHHQKTVTAWALTSEVVIAGPPRSPAA